MFQDEVSAYLNCRYVHLTSSGLKIIPRQKQDSENIPIFKQIYLDVSTLQRKYLASISIYDRNR